MLKLLLLIFQNLLNDPEQDRYRKVLSELHCRHQRPSPARLWDRVPPDREKQILKDYLATPSPYPSKIENYNLNNFFL